MTRLRRPIALLTVLLASGGLAACGNHPDKDARVVRIETEGLYLDVGDLKYQVQLSRQLNPNDIQDKALLRGVPAADVKLKSNEVWFGVFLQVRNDADEPQHPSGVIQIIDTQEKVYSPLALDAANEFAYRSTDEIPVGDIIPLEDTPSYDTAVRGSLLLFKLTLDSLDNRPLELKIEGTAGTQQTGIVDLDV